MVLDIILVIHKHIWVILFFSRISVKSLHSHHLLLHLLLIMIFTYTNHYTKGLSKTITIIIIIEIVIIKKSSLQGIE